MFLPFIASFQPKIDFCWNKIERFGGEKFPDCVKILLTKTGYDRMNSLSKIDAERILEIEAHLDTNREWVNELKCCNSDSYKQLAVFKFLPGHKILILGIPEQIERMKEAQEKHGDADNAKKIVTTKSPKTQQTDEEIIQSMVSNLLKFAKKINFPLQDGMLSANNVNDFERGNHLNNFLYKCRFSCPFCEKVFPLRYQTFWMTSNLTKHLKEHMSYELIEVN